MTFDELKKYFDSKSSNMNNDFKIRIHRALTWGKASTFEERIDEKLIKLWISFNALYGSGFTEFSEVRSFLENIISVDNDKLLKKSLIEKSNTIKNFICIPELYRAYWDNEKETRDERERKVSTIIEKKKGKYIEFIRTGIDADDILFDVFDLIYLLRNQIFHGSASYNSSENQQTKKNCIEILELFIPMIIEIMINNPDFNWHEVKYKPIQNEKFIPQTKEERDIAIKVAGWLKKVDESGECKTPPLTKDNRRIVYKILESKGIYAWDKYYPNNETEGLIIRKKNTN